MIGPALPYDSATRARAKKGSKRCQIHRMAPESQDLKLNFRKRFGGLLPPIIISAVFPVLIYLLASPHMSTLPALALTAVPPMLYSVYGWVRTHSIDPISIITLFMVVISMLITLLVHDPHLFLILRLLSDSRLRPALFDLAAVSEASRVLPLQVGLCTYP